jgi:hypothetical protein
MIRRFLQPDVVSFASMALFVAYIVVIFIL